MIAVVGAGPAGLRAAMLLEVSGFDVQIFEARDRIGGRLHTIARRTGLIEAGAEWIDSDHRRVLKLAKQLGAAIQPASQWPGRLLCMGDWASEDDVWEDAALDAQSVHEEAARLCREMPDDPWNEARWKAFDERPLSTLLDHFCTSRRGRWLAEAIQRSDEGEDTNRVGLLGWLILYRHYLQRKGNEMSHFRFAGGTSDFCERMARSLKRDILLNKTLVSVSQRNRGVELGFEGETVTAERVVLAVPPAVLQQLEIDPEPSPELRHAWSRMPMARAIKVSLEFTHRFWVDQGYSGRILSDLPFQQIWDGGIDGAPVLQAYICGDGADRVRKSPDPVGMVLRALAEVDTQAADAFVRGQLHDWIADPLCQGAFVSMAPGAVFEALPQLSNSDSDTRITYAGEHMATWRGFIEGALQSAEIAVERIRDAEALSRS